VEEENEEADDVACGGAEGGEVGEAEQEEEVGGLENEEGGMVTGKERDDEGTDEKEERGSGAEGAMGGGEVDDRPADKGHSDSTEDEGEVGERRGGEPISRSARCWTTRAAMSVKQEVKGLWGAERVTLPMYVIACVRGSK
jgi:hypothetical protein